MTDREGMVARGVFRRRIRLICRDRLVETTLEDDFHRFRLDLNHDGHHITAIDAETLNFRDFTDRASDLLSP